MVLALVLLLGLSGGALAAGEPDIDALVSGSAAYVYGQVPSPTVGSDKGEWAVLGLARAGYDVPQSWYDGYYSRVKTYVKSAFDQYGDLGLNVKNYTEYSRLIVGLASIGKDARNVQGCDLVSFLGDYNMTIWQGNNGPIWALMALDSANYPMPVKETAAVHATRQMYIDLILEMQLADGGWVLNNDAQTIADPDMTGMALQALAKYKAQPAVAAAIEKGLACIRNMIRGSLLDYWSTTSESIDQILVALCELGVDYRDAAYTKSGSNLLDALLKFRKADGSFYHIANESGADQGNNQMSAEQGLYALVAVQRFLHGQNSLYRMTDVLNLRGFSTPNFAGSRGENAAVAVKSDGSVSITLQFGRNTTVLLESQGAFTAGTNTFAISGTTVDPRTGASVETPCVVITESSDSSYSKREISTISNNKHLVELDNSEKIIIAVKGDLTGDGLITSTDANQALRIAVGKRTPTAIELLACDVVGNGNGINSTGANRLLRVAVGKATIPW